MKPDDSQPDQSNRSPKAAARVAQVLADVIRRRSDAQRVPDGNVIEAHPELMPELGEKLRALRRVERAEQRARSTTVGADSLSEAEQAIDESAMALPADAFRGYKLLEEIYRGGQGVVYRAVQKGTRRQVAIKVMREGPFLGPRDIARFDREVRILARLNHPNIVTIHESGSASGNHFFVMDYIEGRPLDIYLADKDRSVTDILRLFAVICEAVNAAHLCGIVHRDLKPGNILVDAGGDPKILDFGLAKFGEQEDMSVSQSRPMTVTGQFVGTLPWASPEQAGGEKGQIDLRTDVYSLGVILYQMLTEKFPYPVAGKMHDVLNNILEVDPVRPSSIRKEIGEEVETIVLKCLAKDCQRRYQSAGEVARDIRHYLAGEAIEAKRDSTLYVLRKHLRRHRVLLAVLAGFLLLLVASSVIAWTLYARSQDNLWKSYLAQARATRRTKRMGHRIDSLDALAKAAAIRPSIELRNEAIAAMALTDLRVVKRIDTGFASAHDVRGGFSRQGGRYWLYDIPKGILTVRRVADDRTLLTLSPAVGQSWIPRFSRDGHLIVWVLKSGCEVWDIDRGERVKTISVDVSHRHCPYDFSPDNQEIAVGCEDGSIHIHSLKTDDARVLKAVHKPVHAIRYRPAGDLLATTSFYSEDHNVLIRDAGTGEVLQFLKHPAIVWSIAWSPDGTRLAAGCENTNLYVWKAASGLLHHILRGHRSTVIPVGFDPTGDLLFSASWGGATRLWDARTGDQLLVMQGAGRAFTAEPSRFVVRNENNGVTLEFAEVVRSNCLISLVGPAAELPIDRSGRFSISPDGRWIASGTTAGIRIWDAARGRQIAFLPTGASLGAVFGPDGSELITISPVQSGALRWPLRIDKETIRIGPPEVIFRSLPGRLMESRLTADGCTLLVAVHDQGRVLVFDLQRPGEPRSIGPHRSVRYLSISPDDRWLATGSWRGRDVKIWNLTSGELVHEIPIHRSADIAFSPDGKWLVTSEVEHTLWRTGTWQPAARLPIEGTAQTSGSIAFSPDGRLLAISPMRSWIDLVDLAKLEVIARLPCPGQPSVESLAFTPDGARLVYPNRGEGHILYAWDLRAIRRRLASMNLDWDLPAYPPATPSPSAEPLRVEIDLGELTPQRSMNSDRSSNETAQGPRQ